VQYEALAESIPKAKTGRWSYQERTEVLVWRELADSCVIDCCLCPAAEIGVMSPEKASPEKAQKVEEVYIAIESYKYIDVALLSLLLLNMGTKQT
jgi:hypothetical protein